MKIITCVLLWLASVFCMMCAMFAPTLGLSLLCVGLTILTLTACVLHAVERGEM